jgi:hypothetical protein
VALWVLVVLIVFLGLAAIRRVPRRRGTVVAACGTVAGGLLVLSLCLWLPPVARVPDAGPRMVAAWRLREIGGALHAYASDHAGRLPPAAVRDQDGRPLLSWRVLLLPYLEQADLYREFRLDEPWDGPHNVALLPRMPEVYSPPPVTGLRVDPSATFWQVFVGPGTAFEGPDGLRLPEDFPDGTSNTILVAEAGEPVPWTKPADLPYGPGRPLPPLGGVFGGRHTEVKGFHVALADGSVRLVRPSVTEATVRDAITRNDGRSPGPDW